MTVKFMIIVYEDYLRNISQATKTSNMSSLSKMKNAQGWGSYEPSKQDLIRTYFSHPTVKYSNHLKLLEINR